jgi:hypothetical protein
MIGRMGEYRIHQTVATLDRGASADMNWLETTNLIPPLVP